MTIKVNVPYPIEDIKKDLESGKETSALLMTGIEN